MAREEGGEAGIYVAPPAPQSLGFQAVVPGSGTAAGDPASATGSHYRSLPCGEGGSWPTNPDSGFTAAADGVAWALSSTHKNDLHLHPLAIRDIHKVFQRGMKLWVWCFFKKNISLKAH